MKLFTVNTIEALGPRKRVHTAQDWFVPADNAEEALAKLHDHINDGWCPKIVHVGKPVEHSFNRPWLRQSWTMTPEDVQKRMRKKLAKAGIR